MLRSSIAMMLTLLLSLAVGCHRLRERHEAHEEHSAGDEPAIVIGDQDKDHHSEEHHSDEHHSDGNGSTTTTTTVHHD